MIERREPGSLPSRGKILTALLLCIVVSMASTSVAQDPALTDPTRESEAIRDTMAKIKEVEKLDSYVNENTALKEQNKTLLGQLADLTKQVQALTSQLAEQKEQLQKQLLQMPAFTVKSKIIGNGVELAVLETGGKTIRIRNQMELSVSVSDGVWVLMRVENISKEVIELNFPEMARTIFLYD